MYLGVLRPHAAAFPTWRPSTLSHIMLIFGIYQSICWTCQPLPDGRTMRRGQVSTLEETPFRSPFYTLKLLENLHPVGQLCLSSGAVDLLLMGIQPRSIVHSINLLNCFRHRWPLFLWNSPSLFTPAMVNLPVGINYSSCLVPVDRLHGILKMKIVLWS